VSERSEERTTEVGHRAGSGGVMEGGVRSVRNAEKMPSACVLRNEALMQLAFCADSKTKHATWKQGECCIIYIMIMQIWLARWQSLAFNLSGGV